MKISQLFKVISKNKDFDDITKRVTYNFLRKLLKNKHAIGVENDVFDMFMHYDDIVKALSKDIEDAEFIMNDIFNIKQVANVLRKYGAYDDESDEDTEYEEDTDQESDEDEDDSDVSDDDTGSEDSCNDRDAEIEYLRTICDRSTKWKWFSSMFITLSIGLQSLIALKVFNMV